LAEKYGITRAECDEYSLRSQHLYQAAAEARVFDAEITPVEVKGKKGKEMVSEQKIPNLFLHEL